MSIERVVLTDWEDATKEVTARKEHSCFSCGEKIEKSEVYVYYDGWGRRVRGRSSINGFKDWIRARFHLDCYKALLRHEVRLRNGIEEGKNKRAVFKNLQSKLRKYECTFWEVVRKPPEEVRKSEHTCVLIKSKAEIAAYNSFLAQEACFEEFEIAEVIDVRIIPKKTTRVDVQATMHRSDPQAKRLRKIMRRQ